MKQARQTITQVLLLAVGAVLVATISIAMAGPSAKCPLIYAPVICDGGKVYSNQCLADQHHAKNCVPYGL